MERVLITGLTGKSGKYFLEELIERFPQEMDLYAIARPSSNIDAIKKSNLGISLLFGDLEDDKFLENSIKDMDTVFHIAGIQRSLKVVKAATKNNVKRLILVHTTGIYSRYKTAGEEYIRIESEISKIIEDKDISLTILRPTMIYGSLNDSNIVTFIKMVDKFKLFPVVNGGTFALQPVHQKDLGKAYYQVLLNPAKANNNNYDLSGGTVIDLIDILKSISKYLNKKTYFISVPFSISYIGSIMVYYLSLKNIDFREKVQRLVEPRAYSHEKASTDFGYKPIDFQEGLKAEVREYLAQPNTVNYDIFEH